MDKNTAIGLVLIVLIFIGFSYWGQPSKEELEQQKRQQDSIELVKEREASKKAVAAQQQKIKAEAAALDTNSVLYTARNGKEQDVVLKNEKIELTLSTKGGVFKKAVLKNYKDQKGNDLTLFDAAKGEAALNFAFAGKNENIRTNEMFFTPVNASSNAVTMRLQTANGYIDFDYSLKEYMVSLDIKAVGMDGFFAPSTKTVDIDWVEKARQQEKGFTFENQRSSLTFKEKGESSDYLSETKDDSQDLEKPADWIAFKNQFFSYVMIGQNDLNDVKVISSLEPEKSGYIKNYSANMKTSFDATGNKPTKIQFYVGPNDFKILQDHNELSNGKKNLDLEELVYLGWPLLRWINRFFTLYVFEYLTQWGLNMGIVLLLITILLKLITFPLVRKSYLSSAKMRVLRPKMDEITKKYGPDEQMKRQQEMMGLYSKYGVSPMGGCLPMLIQMPVWIAMFNFVPNAIQLRGESFLWAKDLSTYDDIISWNFHIIGIGDHLSLFCILFSVSNLVYTSVQMKLQSNMPGQQDQMKMMKYMMYIMPVMFFFWFNDYSAGLSYYYFVSLLISILIMWFLRKTTNDEKLLAKLERYYEANKNNPKKQSGWTSRLQQMQEQLEEQQKLQQQKRK